MFFRREKPHLWNFEERLADLKKLGFAIRMESGRARVSRDGCVAIVESTGDGNVKLDKTGVAVGDEIATLVHGGYQMFLRTPSGRELPALAPQLKALHAFDEDLREGLGLPSLYNVSLGTTCDDHLYDRVEDRDAPRHPHPWESKLAANR
ncbi:MAG TPA: hypothetical protein VN841_15565 [Bryobacteraceae bacterium]|nr:hypothetical protein [Bryobacteraceae bacterium]